MHAPPLAYRSRLVALVLLGSPLLALAGNTLPVPCAPANLIAAINQANAESGDTLVLAAGCTYTFTVGNNDWYGRNALPPIQSTMTIEGNGATLRASHAGDPTPGTGNAFRFFYVSGGMESLPGNLTLHNLTLSGGYAKGGDAHYGGAGAGMGGAIFNQGTLALRAVTVVGNTAQGGNSGVGNIFQGAGIGQNPGTSGFGGGMGGALPGAFFPLSAGGSANGTAGGGGGGFLSDDSGASGGSGGGLGGVGGSASGDGGDGGGSDPGNSGNGGGGFGLGGGGNKLGGGGGGVGGGGGSGSLVGGGGGFGGGGGRGTVLGGRGGFGGGGGSAFSGGSGNAGGFGGGGGGVDQGAGANGGAGAGLGGAIFNHAGSVSLSNVTLTGNAASGGASSATDGSGLGGAIFNLNGSIEISFSTIAQNTVAGTNGAALGGGPGDGAIYSLAYGNDVENGAPSYALLSVANSIVFSTRGAGGAGQNEIVNNAVNGHGTNLAVLTFSGSNIVGTLSNTSLLGLSSTTPLTVDPHLGSLSPQASTGAPRTLPISAQSAAYNAAASCNDVNGNPVTLDERGTARPQFTQCDLGAYEFDGDYIFANGFE